MITDNSHPTHSRNLRTPTDWEKRFSRFVTGSCAGAVFSTLVLILDGGIVINLFNDDIVFFFVIYFAVVATAHFAIICIAQYEIMKASKAVDGSENSRLRSEIDRFHEYLLLIFIVTVTIVVELLSLIDFDESFASFITVDILKAFSSLLIFAVCIWKNEVLSTLSENYNEVENVLVQNEVSKP